MTILAAAVGPSIADVRDRLGILEDEAAELRGLLKSLQEVPPDIVESWGRIRDVARAAVELSRSDGDPFGAGRRLRRAVASLRHEDLVVLAGA